MAGALEWRKTVAQSITTYIKPHSVYAFLGRKRGEQPNSSESKLYAPLSPVSTISADEVEMRILKDAFENRHRKSIFNIGITGPYGSGKSSLIQSFLKHNPAVKPTMVSLANFRLDVADEKEAKAIRKKLEKGTTRFQIETEILQQILYSADADDLPSSRFQRIPKQSRFQEFIVTAVLAALFGLLGVWGADAVSKIMRQSDLSDTWRAVILVVSLLGAYPFARTLSRQVRRLFATVGKIRLTQIEVDLQKTDKASMLNEAIDEIIHYFEQTKSNCLVIEDLDRYGSVDLFTSLRELSDILKRNPRTRSLGIVFIYAVKDELFKDETRTKFFDVIVPVKPHTSKYNSDVKFAALNKEMGLGVNPDVIQDLSTFVESNRVVLNICNEMKVTLGRDEYNIEKDSLFALTVYKNLFPADYAELLQGRGAIPQLFREVGNVKAQLELELRQEALSIGADLIAPIEAKLPLNEKQLKAEYVSTFVLDHYRQRSSPSIMIGRASMMSSQSVEEMFEVIRNAISVNHSGFSFEEWQKSVSEEPYVDRLARFGEHGQKLKQKHLDRVEEIKQEISELRAAKPAFVYNHLSGIKKTEKLTAEQLARFLVRNEYIDSDYTTLVVSRNEGHFTPADHAFILAVKRGHQVDPTSNIQVDKVFDALRVTYFKKPNILHYQIVFHAASNPLNLRSKELLEVLEPNAMGTREVVNRALDHFRAEHNTVTLLGWLLQANVAHAEYLSQRVNDPEVEGHLIQELQSLSFEAIDDKVLPKTRHFIEDQSQFVATADNNKVAVEAAIAVKVKWRNQNLTGLNEDVISLVRENDLIEISQDTLKQFAQLETRDEYAHYEYVVKALVAGELTTTLAYVKRHVAWFFADLIKHTPHEDIVPSTTYTLFANWITPESLRDEDHIVHLLPIESIHPGELEIRRWQTAAESDKFKHDWTTASELLPADEGFGHILSWLDLPTVHSVLADLEEPWPIDVSDATALIESAPVSTRGLEVIAHQLPQLNAYTPEKVRPAIFTALAKAQKLPLIEEVLDWAEANAPTAGRYLITDQTVLQDVVLEQFVDRVRLAKDALSEVSFADQALTSVLEFHAESDIKWPIKLVHPLLTHLCRDQARLDDSLIEYLLRYANWTSTLTDFVGIQIGIGYKPSLKELRKLEGYSDLGPGRKSIRLKVNQADTSILKYAQNEGWIGKFRKSRTSSDWIVYNKQ